MNKYDSMIACNKKASEEKVNRAVTEIRQMLTERGKSDGPKTDKRGQDCPEDSFIRMKRSEKKWIVLWSSRQE